MNDNQQELEMVPMQFKQPFNAKSHLMQIKSKEGSKDYLPVQWRLVWFKSLCPEGTIKTELVHLDLDRETEEEVYVWNNEKRRSEKVIKYGKGIAVFKATISDGKGGMATGTKMEKAASFSDWLEKAETGAIGRALAGLGYGTQFTADELNESHRIVDSPVIPEQPAASNTVATVNRGATRQPQAKQSPLKTVETPVNEGSIDDALRTQLQKWSLVYGADPYLRLKKRMSLQDIDALSPIQAAKLIDICVQANTYHAVGSVYDPTGSMLRSTFSGDSVTIDHVLDLYEIENAPTYRGRYLKTLVTQKDENPTPFTTLPKEVQNVFLAMERTLRKKEQPIPETIAS